MVAKLLCIARGCAVTTAMKLLPTWRAAQAEDWLGRWAMSLMLINVSTRKLRRAVRLPEGDLPVINGSGRNALRLGKLRDEGAVKILKFDDSILKTFLAVSKDVVAEAGHATISPRESIGATKSSAR